MELWDRLLTLFRMMRGVGLRRYELNEQLHAALVRRADLAGRTAEDVQAELVAAGLEQLRSTDQLKERWDTLSRREKTVTALTCLGYTNRQIASRIGLSPDTVKGYVHSALVKWNLHSKATLRQRLEQWDFSEWGPPADE